jgi:endoglucanase
MSKNLSSILFLLSFTVVVANSQQEKLQINSEGYYESHGVNVMVFDDFYPEGHQGGLTIVQAGRRIAANGDLRLEPAPGQWAPVPTVGQRRVDAARGEITVELWYPDSSKNRKGFNPIEYPDLRFRYHVTTTAEGSSIRLRVDLDRTLPAEWAGKVGFNLELFPGIYFGEHFLMDGTSGLLPRQANGPVKQDQNGSLQPAPLATGKELVIAPGNREKELRFRSEKGSLELLDGRGLHNNGWFVLRSTIPAGAAERAVEWIISPKADPAWKYTPVIQVSQVGYHPRQSKFAVIELDKSTVDPGAIQLVRVRETGESVVKEEKHPKPWGKFLRFTYVRFDFSDVTAEGLYRVRYGNLSSNEFEIKKTVYSRDVWQPSLAYFLPIQMCHMQVRDRYKVWHGYCHMDDARMAPLNHNHFDGYYQHESTLTRFMPGDHIPGLNVGGWHDAGDYDLRVESQAETVYKLALAYEFFPDNYDETSIDQNAHTVELHRPDGKPDILQQIEHGVLGIVGPYKSMGRLDRGIICSTLRQYVHLGDAAAITDNLIYKEGEQDSILHKPLPNDDRWVFTEENPPRELYVAQCLAAVSRVLSGLNPGLASDCLNIAEELFQKDSGANFKEALGAAGELYLTTSKPTYETFLKQHANELCANVMAYSEVLGRVTRKLDDPPLTRQVSAAVKKAFVQVADRQKENPYGVPYKPYIWGAGWGIQSLGVKQLFLHMGYKDIFPAEYALNALNFVLGCHPGENTSSFASGVGVHSLTVAYGTNRDEWSYIPGGIASGTALIRPDLPELNVWPYFWQQTEYVMGGGTVDFMILAMAADRLLNQE